MKAALYFLAAVMAFAAPAKAQNTAAAGTQNPEDKPVVTNHTALNLESQFDFGKYTMSVPAGLLQRSGDGQYHAVLPDGRFSMMIMETQGAAKDLKEMVQDAAKSLKLGNGQLKKVEADGMDGYMVSERKGKEVQTLAVLRDGKNTITFFIREAETLQPLAPQAVASVKKR